MSKISSKLITKKAAFWSFFCLFFLLTTSGCSYHQRNTHRLIKLTVDQNEKNNERNFQYSQQAYGGIYYNDPELTEYIKTVANKVAKNFPNTSYSVILVSSSIPNIWSFPQGKIAITRGLLLELDNEAELAAIFAHEMAHLQKSHGIENVQEVQLNAGPVNLNILNRAKSKEFLVGALGSGSGLITMQYTLSSEMEADSLALKQVSKVGYTPKSFSDFSERVYSYDQTCDCNWKGGFLAKHPTSDERLNCLRQQMATLSPLGMTETNHYHQKIEKLKQRQEAYSKLDEGYQLLLSGDYSQAIKAAGQGLNIDPTEFHFYLLKGKAFFKLGYTLDALNSLNRAIELNPKYFDNYLQRGLVKEQLDDFAQASNDLEKSLVLLPTAEAYYALGEIDYRQDQRQAAIENFRKASIAKTPGGEKAIFRLKELGLPLNGLQTIDAALEFDDSGFVNLRISNTGLTSQKHVVIDVNQIDPQGKSIYHHLVELEKELSPQESVCHQTNIGPFINEEHMRKATRVNPIYSE